MRKAISIRVWGGAFLIWLLIVALFAGPYGWPAVLGAFAGAAVFFVLAMRDPNYSRRRCAWCRSSVRSDAVICAHCGRDPLGPDLRA